MNSKVPLLDLREAWEHFNSYDASEKRQIIFRNLPCTLCLGACLWLLVVVALVNEYASTGMAALLSLCVAIFTAATFFVAILFKPLVEVREARAAKPVQLRC